MGDARGKGLDQANQDGRRVGPSRADASWNGLPQSCGCIIVGVASTEYPKHNRSPGAPAARFPPVNPGDCGFHGPSGRRHPAPRSGSAARSGRRKSLAGVAGSPKYPLENSPRCERIRGAPQTPPSTTRSDPRPLRANRSLCDEGIRRTSEMHPARKALPRGRCGEDGSAVAVTRRRAASGGRDRPSRRRGRDEAAPENAGGEPPSSGTEPTMHSRRGEPAGFPAAHPRWNDRGPGTVESDAYAGRESQSFIVVSMPPRLWGVCA